MSVINQMLKDLEKQRVTTLQSENTPVNIVNERKFNAPVVALSVAIVAITAGAGFMFWQKQAATPSNRAVKNAPEELQTMTVAAQVDAGEGIERVMAEVNNQTPKQLESNISNVTTKAEIQVGEIKPLTIVKVPEVKAEKPTVVAPENTPLSAPTVVTQLHEKAQILPIAVTEITPVAAESEITPTAQLEDTTVELADLQVIIKKISHTTEQQAALYQAEAEDAYLAGDSDKAKQRFQQVLNIQADNNASREQLAAILFGEKRTQSAVNLLQQGLSVSPEYANFRLMLARIYMKNNDKKQAYYYLKPYQPEVVGHLDYYALLAGLAQNLADLDVAFSAYSKLTEVDPNRAKWWLGLGITADKLQRSAFALNAYQTAQAMGQLSAASRKYIDTRIALLEK